MHKHEAILFDLDGTLLDTLGDIAASMNRVLADEGCPGHPAASYRYFVGDGMDTLVKRALPEDRRDDDTVAACHERMRKDYAAHQYDSTVPYNGIAGLLETLSARGIVLAVLSNKPDHNTVEMIARYFPGISFAAVRGMRAGIARKPDPAGALAIAAELGIAPASFMYVGDTATDMMTAVGRACIRSGPPGVFAMRPNCGAPARGRSSTSRGNCWRCCSRSVGPITDALIHSTALAAGPPNPLFP